MRVERCPRSCGMLSAITAECCPPSAWNRVRDRAEYALYQLVDAPSLALLAFLKKKYRDLYDDLRLVFNRQYDYEGKNEADDSKYEQTLLNCMVAGAAGKKVSYLQQHFSPILEELTDIIWVERNRVEIEQAIQAVKAKRILAIMENKLPRRIFDDLQRAFYRTLAEFRRHQYWRRVQHVVDVTPAPQMPDAKA